MTVFIRRAFTLSTDSALLNKLGYSIYCEHFKHLWVSVLELNAYLHGEYSPPKLEHSLQDPGVCWYIVETDHPIGFAKLTWSSTIPDTNISGVQLNKIYLSQKETGKNYGKVVFDEIVNIAQQGGKRFLWLEVLKQNARARKFYENQGMRHIKDVTFETASQRSTLHVLGMDI